MNDQTILALTGIDLASHVAQRLGYTIIDSPQDVTGGAPTPPACYIDRSDNRGLLCWQARKPLHEFRPDRDHNHAREILRYIEALQQQPDFIAALWYIVDKPLDPWSLITATPADLCRALILMRDH